MTDVPPPDTPKPPRGRPRRTKPIDDEAVLSDEEVARRVDVRGGGTPRAPVERAPVRDRRPPPRRPERVGGRDSLLLIGLVVAGLVAVRLFLPDGPLTASATSAPSGSQAAVTSATPGVPATLNPTGGVITLPPSSPAPTGSIGPITEPPITAPPLPTPTLKPGQTPAPTPRPTRTPTPTTGPTPQATATIKVVVNVINGDGGTANAAAWSIAVTSAGTATPNSFSGSSTGTLVTVSAGVSYTVSSSGPSGYAKTPSLDCASSTGGLPVANQAETCTILVNDIAPKITVFTIVDNNGAGTLSPSDLTVTVTGTHVRPTTSFPGSAGGIGVTVDANTAYDINHPAAPADYDRSADSPGCDGSGLALGATATCTVTYTYDPPAPTDSPPPEPGLLLPFLALPWRRRSPWRSNLAG